MLAAIDPTDSTAVGAVATVRGGRLHLLADISRPDGSGRIVLRAVGVVGAGREGVRAAQALGAATAAAPAGPFRSAVGGGRRHEGPARACRQHAGRRRARRCATRGLDVTAEPFIEVAAC